MVLKHRRSKHGDVGQVQRSGIYPYISRQQTRKIIHVPTQNQQNNTIPSKLFHSEPFIRRYLHRSYTLLQEPSHGEPIQGLVGRAANAWIVHVSGDDDAETVPAAPVEKKIKKKRKLGRNL